MKKTMFVPIRVFVVGLMFSFILAVPAQAWQTCPTCKHWSTSQNKCVCNSDGTSCSSSCKECRGCSCVYKSGNNCEDNLDCTSCQDCTNCKCVKKSGVECDDDSDCGPPGCWDCVNCNCEYQCNAENCESCIDGACVVCGGDTNKVCCDGECCDPENCESCDPTTGTCGVYYVPCPLAVNPGECLSGGACGAGNYHKEFQQNLEYPDCIPGASCTKFYVCIILDAYGDDACENLFLVYCTVGNYGCTTGIPG